MKKELFFPDDKMNYDDYLKVVEKMLANRKDLSNFECIEVGVSAMTALDSLEKRKKLIAVSMESEKMFNNCVALPLSIVTVANIIANHSDLVNGLTNKQIAFLGLFSFGVKSSDMGNHLRKVGNKRILDSVFSKTDNIHERIDILELVESKNNLFVDGDCEIGSDEFVNKATNFINNNSKEDLLGMVTPIIDAMKEAEKKGVRFF